jgi:hypothetical protein
VQRVQSDRHEARGSRALKVGQFGLGKIDVELRKILTFVDEAAGEAGRSAEPPLRKVAIVAVLKNPFAGHYAADLAQLTDASLAIGRRISAQGVAALAPWPVQSYGKAGLVGLAGEQEHAAAMLTTVFGNAMRDAIGGGKAWISSMTKRSAPGSTIDIPLAHKDALYVRSHYDGITITLHDAPLPDEIAIIAAFANRGRLNHRVGGLAAADIKGADGLV